MSLMMLTAVMAMAAADTPQVEVIRGNEISPAPAAVVRAASTNPHAIDLVESNPAIQQWALRTYDRNRDGWLSLYEAQPAVTAFEEIADEDRDGHVTVREYQAAVNFLRARY